MTLHTLTGYLKDSISAYYITCVYLAPTVLYLRVQDETVADQGRESLHPHHPQPSGAGHCTPGPLSCYGSPELVRKVAVGRAVQLVACVLLSVQTTWGEMIVAVAAAAAGGGFDGAEDKKCQLCACSSYSAKQKKEVKRSNNFACIKIQ